MKNFIDSPPAYYTDVKTMQNTSSISVGLLRELLLCGDLIYLTLDDLI